MYSYICEISFLNSKMGDSLIQNVNIYKYVKYNIEENRN